MQHAHDLCRIVDREEDAVGVRLPPVRQYSDRVIRIEALGRDWTALRVLIEGKNGPFETVEPPCTLLRRTIDDPQIQFLEIESKPSRAFSRAWRT
jgi:hypothetical protein